MQKKRNSLNQKIKLLFLITPVVMFLTIYLVSLIFNAPVFINGDSSNWITSVIETGIGASITIAILVYSNNQQRHFEDQQEKIAELVLNIQKIEQRHEHREKKRLTVFCHRIISNLDIILQNHYELKQGLIECMSDNTEETRQTLIFTSEKNLESLMYFILPNLKSDTGYIGDLFEDPLLGKNIINQCNEYGIALKDIRKNFDWKNDSILKKISLIDNHIETLTVTIDQIKKELSEKF